MSIWTVIIAINILLLVIFWAMAPFIFKKSAKGLLATISLFILLHLLAYGGIHWFYRPIEGQSYLDYFLYPNLVGHSFLFLLAFRPKREHLVKNKEDNIKVPYHPGRYDFVLATAAGGDVRFSDPFDNWLVYAGANSGKTKSIGYQLLENYIKHGFCGLLYDYKENDYGKFLAALLEKYPDYGPQAYFVNFTDPSRSSRFNLIKPSLFQTHTELAQTLEDIFLNYAGEQNDRTWINASLSLVKGVATLLYHERPEDCTLPFLYNAILHNPVQKLVERCSGNTFARSYVQPIKSVLESPKTLASMTFTLYPLLGDFANDRTLCYVLSGDDFDFNLIDPAHPKLVCLGNSLKQEGILSPIMGAIFRASTRAFSLANKLDFFYFMDEATTFKIKDFETMPSVLREFRASFTFITQSSSKIVLRYSKEAKSSIESNFGNQLFGKTKDVQAAKDYSLVFEKAVEKARSETQGTNKGGSSSSVNDSLRMVSKYEISDFTGLPPGRFIGSGLHSNYREFCKQFSMSSVVPAKDVPKIREVSKDEVMQYHDHLVKRCLEF